ncbi:hypothetical protein PRZ48_011671 [Zasmidium cellare]|uniref:Flavin reductase like domain-containing protein n=1 Tax=Zasmidium cellare TaxID=395010 RepID=A0ABR0E706_ZASCE|nr:hypothetical protein PRZ48_011671 [Zasmidium cellare]
MTPTRNVTFNHKEAGFESNTRSSPRIRRHKVRGRQLEGPGTISPKQNKARAEKEEERNDGGYQESKSRTPYRDRRPIPKAMLEGEVVSAAVKPFDTMDAGQYVVRFRSEAGLMLEYAIAGDILQERQERHGAKLERLKDRTGARIEVQELSKKRDGIDDLSPSNMVHSVLISGTFQEVAGVFYALDKRELRKEDVKDDTSPQQTSVKRPSYPRLWLEGPIRPASDLPSSELPLGETVVRSRTQDHLAIEHSVAAEKLVQWQRRYGEGLEVLKWQNGGEIILKPPTVPEAAREELGGSQPTSSEVTQPPHHNLYISGPWLTVSRIWDALAMAQGPRSAMEVKSHKYSADWLMTGSCVFRRLPDDSLVLVAALTNSQWQQVKAETEFTSLAVALKVSMATEERYLRTKIHGQTVASQLITLTGTLEALLSMRSIFKVIREKPLRPAAGNKTAGASKLTDNTSGAGRQVTDVKATQVLDNRSLTSIVEVCPPSDLCEPVCSYVAARLSTARRYSNASIRGAMEVRQLQLVQGSESSVARAKKKVVELVAEGYKKFGIQSRGIRLVHERYGWQPSWAEVTQLAAHLDSQSTQGPSNANGKGKDTIFTSLVEICPGDAQHKQIRGHVLVRFDTIRTLTLTNIGTLEGKSHLNLISGSEEGVGRAKDAIAKMTAEAYWRYGTQPRGIRVVHEQYDWNPSRADVHQLVAQLDGRPSQESNIGNAGVEPPVFRSIFQTAGTGKDSNNGNANLEPPVHKAVAQTEGDGKDSSIKGANVEPYVYRAVIQAAGPGNEIVMHRIRVRFPSTADQLKASTGCQDVVFLKDQIIAHGTLESVVKFRDNVENLMNQEQRRLSSRDRSRLKISSRVHASLSSVWARLPAVHQAGGVDEEKASQLAEDVRIALRPLSHPVALITSQAPRVDVDEVTSENDESASQTGLEESVDDNVRRSRGITVSSFNTVALRPQPLVSFNISVPSRSWDAISRSADLRVHLLTATPIGAAIADCFTKRLKQPYSGFLRAEKLGVELKFNGEDAPPRLFHKEGVLAELRAKLLPERCMSVGDHIIVVARVTSCFLPGVEEGLTPAQVDRTFWDSIGGLAYAKQSYRNVGAQINKPDTIILPEDLPDPLSLAEDSAQQGASRSRLNLQPEQHQRIDSASTAVEDQETVVPEDELEFDDDLSPAAREEEDDYDFGFETPNYGVKRERRPSASTRYSSQASASDLWGPEDVVHEDSIRLGGGTRPKEEENSKSEATSDHNTYRPMFSNSNAPGSSQASASDLWDLEDVVHEDSIRLGGSARPKEEEESKAEATLDHNTYRPMFPNSDAFGSRGFSTLARPMKISARHFSTTARVAKDSVHDNADLDHLVEPSARNMNVADYLGVPENARLHSHRVRSLFRMNKDARRAEKRLLERNTELTEEDKSQLRHQITTNDRIIAKKLAWNAAYHLRIMLDKGRVDFKRAQFLESAIEKGQSVLLEEAALATSMCDQGRINFEQLQRVKKNLAREADVYQTELTRLGQVVDEEGDGGGVFPGVEEGGGDGFDGFGGNR